MGDFDCIETGFNCEDETINFGSRYIAYDNLYEISTVACFKSSETDVKVSILINYKTSSNIYSFLGN